MIDPGLRGRVVLVTGANNPRGIGAATARALAGLGCSVFIHFLREPGEPPAEAPEPGEALYGMLKSCSADTVVEDITRRNGRAAACELDLAAPGHVTELFDKAEAQFGPVDVLVNNAAHCVFDTFVRTTSVFGESSTEQAEPITVESHDRHFAVNSRAPALLMAEYARRFVARRASWGRIVNISTDASSAHAGAVSYGASKHALESYSRAAAYELGQFGVTVNVVAPGPVQTGWIGTALEAQIVPAIPLGRIGSPQDIADAVVFFASDQARWITGQTLYVGGGKVMPL